MPEPRHELGTLWRSINREMHELFRDAFRGHPFSPVMFFLIQNIHGESGITLNELARRAGIVKSHVSKMVDHLASHGLVEKRPDPDDQRLVRLHLTQAASDTRAEMECRATAVLDRVLAEISEAEIAEIVSGLRILLRALHTAKEKVKA